MRFTWWRNKKYRGDTLKERIRKRLATEDYTCRLPKVDKPRVRYKLRRYKMVIAGKVETVWS